MKKEIQYSVLNIFLVHTGFQKFMAEHLLSCVPELIKGKNIAYVNDSNLTQRMSKKKWQEVYNIFPEIGERYTGLTPIQTKLFKKRILEKYTDVKQVNIFLSNVDYPAANCLLKICTDRDNFNFYSYPEGIANIIPTLPNWKKKLKLIFKIVYGYMLGSPYKYYGTDFSGKKFADKVYSLIEGTDKKTILIPKISIKNSEAKKGGAVIVGQPIYDKNNVNIYINTINYILKLAENKNIDNVYYKPHPRENKLDLLSDIKNLTIVYTDDIAEEYIANNNIKLIAGIFSSSLLHSKLFFRDNVDVVMVSNDQLYRKLDDKMERYKKIEKLFKKYGVKIHKL